MSDAKVREHAKHDEAAKEKERRKQDRKLDQALEDTFPGSDPVSISQPPHSRQDKEAD